MCANSALGPFRFRGRSTISGQTHKTARGASGLLLVWLLSISCAVLPGHAFAATAEELFADGNRLFRDDLYWAALLRYREARDAGMDTPLLYYNMGVAHYKAGQHIRARDALMQAARSPALEVHVHYNLGLNAWALDDIDEALRWFRQARDQQRFPELSKLATEAIARIERELAEKKRPVLVRAEKSRKEKKPLGELDFRFSAGAGSDDNVFRSPAESYVDQSDPNQPVIDPAVQSGTFVPIALRAKYVINTFVHESFFAAYRFEGRFYQEDLLKNADEYAQEISVGSEYRKRTTNRERVIFSAFRIAQHDETYYDRDDGTIPTVDGEEIGARTNYMRYGPEIWFRQSFDRFSFGGRAKAQLWNYEQPPNIWEYDHEFMLVGLSAQYRFTKTSLLRLTADKYHRRFGTRPSHELDGSQPFNNDPVRYDYNEFGVTARQRVTRGLWFGLNYVFTDRRDLYVGYNDYTRNSYGADIHLDIGRRFELVTKATYEVYDYASAFAFNNPSAGRKTLDRTAGSVIATIRMTDHLRLVGKAIYQDVASNDTRLAYNRMQYALSFSWEH